MTEEDRCPAQLLIDRPADVGEFEDTPESPRRSWKYYRPRLEVEPLGLRAARVPVSQPSQNS